MPNKKNIIITSSNNYSLSTLLLCQLLSREDINIVGIISIHLFSKKRLRKTLTDRTLIRPLFEKIINLLFKRKSKRNFESSILADFIRSKNLNLDRNLSLWSKNKKVPIIFVEDLNSIEAYNFLNNLKFDCVVYSGGGILRETFLDHSKFVINAHAGPLPDIRGMNAAEWSYLQNKRSAITIHFIDSGIDTGEIISIFDFDRKNCQNISQLRETAVLTGIKSLVRVLPNIELSKFKRKVTFQDILQRQYFKMSPVLLDKLEAKIKNEKNP